MSTLWAAIRLPQLALDALLRRQREPQRPLAVLAGRLVHSANDAAAAFGVRPGQVLAAAQALCPQLQALPYPEEEARQLRELLAAWAYRYSSQVCCDGDAVLWLEVGASLGLFGPWPRFERLLRDDLTGLGLQHRIALAPTPLGAAVLAGSEDGLAVLDREQLRNAVQRLPLACLPWQRAPLSESTRTALHGMGVRQLRQLLALPRAGLIRRFGRELPELLDRLLGLAPDLRPCYQPPERFAARFEFDHEINLSTSLLFPLKRLVSDLATYLACRDGGVQRFEIVLEHEAHAPTRWPVGLLAPEREASRLFDLARLTLEREQVVAPVVALAVIAEELPPFVPLSQDLFDARPAGAMSWAALQARLVARLGAGRLHQLALQADPRPEYAQRQVACLSGPPLPVPDLPRPSWLLSRPQPFPEAQPRLLAGPERIEAGWWDGADLRRDYYVAETRSGQRAWVFCPPGQHGPYLLHGWFA